jgi:hypothetical protein
MLARELGLTSTYNLISNRTVMDADTLHLRQLHVEIDEAVRDAYEWRDLPLDHGHYVTRQGDRWTVPPSAQAELLDRLLDLNHSRYAEQEAGDRTNARESRRSPAAAMSSAHDQPSLFDEGVNDNV